MKCEDFKFEYTVASSELSDEAIGHQHACADCNEFSKQQDSFEEQLAGAINFSVPSDLRHTLREKIVLHPDLEKGGEPTTWRLPKSSMALAASVVMAVGLVGYYLSPNQSNSVPLNQLVYEHMQHDVRGLEGSHQLQGAELVSLEQEFKLRLKTPKAFQFAERCPIGDTYGLHMVYENGGNPVTVIYMPELSIGQTQPFNYSGFNGWVRPAKKGSIAIVGGSTTNLPEVDERVEEAIEWL
jgi:hypothetical protein